MDNDDDVENIEPGLIQFGLSTNDRFHSVVIVNPSPDDVNVTATFTATPLTPQAPPPPPPPPPPPTQQELEQAFIQRAMTNYGLFAAGLLPDGMTPEQVEMEYTIAQQLQGAGPSTSRR